MSYPSKKQNATETIRFLKKSEHHYLKQYFQSGTLYDDEANECGEITQSMLDKLLNHGIIKKVGTSKEFWSEGYYQLAK